MRWIDTCGCPCTRHEGAYGRPGGETGEITFILGTSIPKGPWKADVTLRSGLLEHTATGRLSFPDAGDGRPVQAMIASVGSHRVVWAGGGAALAALGLRRRGRNTPS
ncbi:hypothetical protein ACWCRF_15975 [Streptomyces sp. NPDC002405]|uniref:hypothetical protein n=1 Tax=Streptomyces sp. NPDC001231 TaxID=3364549 RepID=UPI0036A5D4F3